MQIRINLDEDDVPHAMELLQRVEDLADAIDEMRQLINETRALIHEQKEMP